jgi:hypothetical protein
LRVCYERGIVTKDQRFSDYDNQCGLFGKCYVMR